MSCTASSKPPQQATDLPLFRCNALSQEIDELMMSRMTLDEEEEVQDELAALQRENDALVRLHSLVHYVPSSSRRSND